MVSPTFMASARSFLLVSALVGAAPASSAWILVSIAAGYLARQALNTKWVSVV